MKKTVILIVLILFVKTSHLMSQEKKLLPITVEEFLTKKSFSPKYVRGFVSMKDGKSYTVLQKGSIDKYDYKSGENLETLFSATKYPQIKNIVDYKFSNDEKHILLITQPVYIYRHSFLAKYFIFEIEKGKITEVSNKYIKEAKFSNDGKKIAFVFENNMYYKDLSTNETIQITKDGKKNSIINGHTDWVNEEEFSFTRAYEWSQDDESIAYLKFDETDVKEFSMPLYGKDNYPKPYIFKYPKAGEKNSKISLQIYDIRTKKTQKIFSQNSKVEYIPRIKWTKNNKLSFITLNRYQNELKLNVYNPKDKKTAVWYTETSKTYIDINDNWHFMKNDDFIWTSEQEGFNHIYLYKENGTKKTVLTSGDWDVTDVYGLDEDESYVYFQSTKEGAQNRTISRVNISLRQVQKLSTKTGINDAQFNKTKEYFINTFSNVSTPYEFTIYNAQKNRIEREVETNKALKEKIKKYFYSQKEFLKMNLPNGQKLNYWVIKPKDFDPNKKYPLLMYVYGGPGSQTVQNRWMSGHDFWFQYLSYKGYMIISVDNRGTGYMGTDFKKMTYLQLGKFESDDQVNAAKAFSKFSYIDKKRIGIFGWSYGGFMTLLSLEKGNKVFKTGVSVAPVTHWSFYNTIYTERFMRTPQENPRGYNDNSPISMVEKIKAPFMLVHGTADDNVHFQNSTRIINQFIEKNIDFTFVTFPDKNHGIRGGNSSLYLYNKMTNYILQNL